MNYAEAITGAEQKRAAHVGRLEAIAEKVAGEGRTLDEAEKEERDNLSAEVKEIDDHLKFLREMEGFTAAKAKPVEGKTAEEGSVTRSGSTIEVKRQPKLDPGIPFARYAKVKAIARLDNEPVLQVAERMYGSDSQVVAAIKATVAPGSTASGNWGENLIGDETNTFADFAEFLRADTILGKFGQNGVPSLRRVPFREPLITQTSGGAASWVGEAKPKPLTSLGFDRTTLTPLKVATICVLTEENIRSSAPASEAIVRDSIRDAVTERIDLDFIDPTNSGTSNIKPAAITNGMTGDQSIAASGTGDADDIRLDIRSALQKYIDANNKASTAVLIMRSGDALALSMMVNALGQPEFSGIGMNGGMLLGIPVITSENVPSGYIVVINAADVFLADEGGVNVDMSREASLEMLDGGFTQNPPTGASLVSLWQNNLVGLRAERTINWKRRRDSAVVVISGVAWGGAVTT